MAVYAYVCESGHETCRFAPMAADHPRLLACDTCGDPARRVLGNYQFSKDRTRLFRNPVDGTDFSYSLGQRMPDNRAEYHALLADKGCEPVTPGTEPEIWKANRAYLDHIQHGGERDRAFEATPATPPPKSLTVLEQVRKSNLRIP